MTTEVFECLAKLKGVIYSHIYQEYYGDQSGGAKDLRNLAKTTFDEKTIVVAAFYDFLKSDKKGSVVSPRSVERGRCTSIA